MRAWRAVPILLAAIAASAAPPPAADGHRWQIYGNGRYGYSACYPADLFRPQPELDAHDGVLFTAPRGVTLSVSGEPAEGTSLREVMDAVTHSLDGTVTYRAARPDWMVASGTRGPDTFYARLVRGGGTIAQYVLVYPTARSAMFAPIVRRMNACMKVG